MKEKLALLMRGAAPVLIIATALLSRLLEDFPYWLALTLLASAGLLFLAASRLSPGGRREEDPKQPEE